MSLWQQTLPWIQTDDTEAQASVAAEARTHVGHVRTVNEDRFLSRTDRGFWAVTDGIGGHRGGVAAASVVISALEDMADGTQPLSEEGVLQTLQHANKLICTLNRPNGVSGATIVAARQDGDSMTIYWAGDSRAYRVGAGKVQLVSHDHSYVQELIDAGLIAGAEARDHPKTNVITRALGVNHKVEIETIRVPFLPGDAILLCSDGLSRSLTVRDLTSPSPSLSFSADRLLGNALRRDGTDNVTLVLIQRRI